VALPGAAHKMNRSDLTTCAPGTVWDTKHRKCLLRHSGVLPDSDLTEYTYALAKAERYQEAIDVLDLLDNPNTPRAPNYRGYATRKLGRTDEGIDYYLKSVALGPSWAGSLARCWLTFSSSRASARSGVTQASPNTCKPMAWTGGGCLGHPDRTRWGTARAFRLEDALADDRAIWLLLAEGAVLPRGRRPDDPTSEKRRHGWGLSRSRAARSLRLVAGCLARSRWLNRRRSSRRWTRSRRAERLISAMPGLYRVPRRVLSGLISLCP
jgi:tetratricopeptide (TPR) repeat protein